VTALQSSASLEGDRDYALDLLARAYAAGELDVKELESRAGRALAAATTSELDDSITSVGWSDEERQDLLDREIAAWLASGWKVSWAADTTAALVLRRRPNHLLHAIATFFTGGLWLIGWIAVTVDVTEERLHLEVDEFGNLETRLVR
jgi:hypothetical protein